MKDHQHRFAYSCVVKKLGELFVGESVWNRLTLDRLGA